MQTDLFMSPWTWTALIGIVIVLMLVNKGHYDPKIKTDKITGKQIETIVVSRRKKWWE